MLWLLHNHRWKKSVYIPEAWNLEFFGSSLNARDEKGPQNACKEECLNTVTGHAAKCSAVVRLFPSWPESYLDDRLLPAHLSFLIPGSHWERIHRLIVHIGRKNRCKEQDWEKTEVKTRSRESGKWVGDRWRGRKSAKLTHYKIPFNCLPLLLTNTAWTSHANPVDPVTSPASVSTRCKYASDVGSMPR